MKRTTWAAIIAAVLGGMPIAYGVEFRLLGSIQGKVRDTAGVPQMGANVLLLNRNERILRTILTDVHGRFEFAALPPDMYAVRVSLSTFIPAMRSQIQVRPGATSLLNIQLANLFSSIELVYTAPGQSGVLSEDWKWVLRSDAATRPVLRVLPGLDPGWSSSKRSHSAFALTRGLVKVSAGDSNGASLYGNEPDLGTAFALATSLFGTNELSVSGNLGYASNTGTPTAGFRTTYSRADSVAPDVELTVRQVAMRTRAATGLIGGPGAGDAPVLRTMSVKVADRKKITEEITLDYGTLVETVVFLDRLNVLSPFARLSYDLGEVGVIEVAYSSGAPALDLIETDLPFENPIQDELVGLAMFPRVSLSGGQARVQRTDTYEVGYSRRAGSRLYATSVYRDDIRDMAMTMAGATSALDSRDLLPDLASNSYVFNLGRMTTYGVMASVSQDVGEFWKISGAYGYGGNIVPGEAAELATADELRANLEVARAHWAAGRVAGQVPLAGTKVVTSYMYTPGRSVMASHAFLTQRTQWLPGLNISLRQPLPGLNGMRGRFEMTADLRNLLAQGYLPVAAPDGRSLYLIPFPRSVRGGVSFIF